MSRGCKQFRLSDDLGQLIPTVTTEGMRILVRSSQMVLFCSDDGQRQLARVAVKNRYLVFPVYTDIISGEDVRCLNDVASLYLEFDDFSLSEISEVVVTQYVGERIRQLI